MVPMAAILDFWLETILAIFFWSTSHPDGSNLVSSQLAIWLRRKSEKQIFKMAAMASILDFWAKCF